MKKNEIKSDVDKGRELLESVKLGDKADWAITLGSPVTFLDLSEIYEIFEVAKKVNWIHYFIFKFLYLTGLRPYELLSLTLSNFRKFIFAVDEFGNVVWKDITDKNVDPESIKESLMRFRKKLNLIDADKPPDIKIKQFFAIVFLGGRQKKKYRVVPISKSLEEDLAKFLGIKEVNLRVKNGGPLFNFGKRWLEKLVKKYANMAKIDYKKVTPMSFRHSFGTHMRNMKGKEVALDLKTVSTLMGHAKEETTDKKYVGKDLFELYAAVSNLDENLELMEK